ncbi:MAG: hypothetical protein WC357_02865 [Candidatus Omnitrophota bacterium]|jgi:membrane protein involved in colicin uptake
MCDPVSLTVTGVVLAAAAGGVTAYGQYQSGKSQDKYYKYLADQNEIEAQAAEKTAEQQSTIAQNEAAQKAKELKGDVRRAKGSQRAAMASAGIYGVTADDIISDTINKAKLDAANIRYNADVQSWAANKEAAEKGWALRNQATLFRAAGKQARQAAAINMTGTILGTASSIFGGLGKLKAPTSTGGGTSKIYTGSDFGGFDISPQLKGFNWKPSGLY